MLQLNITTYHFIKSIRVDLYYTCMFCAAMLAMFNTLLCSMKLFFRARLDSVDGEICKFMSGELTAVTTRNNPKRYYRTSISSGYSSHSSPISAGSYSCYASTPAFTRDPSWYGDLAVIHEAETIPRPIWPCALYHHAEDYNIDYEGTIQNSLWCFAHFSKILRTSLILSQIYISKLSIF